MKAISILGTSSNAGKSWVATALCAWLQREGVNVAPFKAQNMSNNAYATLEGGEIGVAQAVQAEACGLRPVAEMNPILLKPSGPTGSQIVRLGKAGEYIGAKNYYQTIEDSWEVVRETLNGWRDKCDVLVMEGAGSPVELNLMDRDIVNLHPINHVDGKWILVSNIEFGGVFAQAIGTWNLLPEEMKERGLGFVVNRFRGDPSLFDEARSEFERRMTLPYLGLLPFDPSLKIDDEDSLNSVVTKPSSGEPFIAWIKYPHVSNTQDQLAWQNYEGIANRWIDSLESLRGASAVVLPGSKNTLSDLRWLKQSGFAVAVSQLAKNNVPVVGICGGYQMLGTEVRDGASGITEKGLGLISMKTELSNEKTVTRREAVCDGEGWETYEIHTGVSSMDSAGCGKALLSIIDSSGTPQSEGIETGSIWGTYQHGLFDSPVMRCRLLKLASVEDAHVCSKSWKAKRMETYDAMADLLETCLDLEGVKRYVGL